MHDSRNKSITILYLKVSVLINILKTILILGSKCEIDTDKMIMNA